VKQAYRWESRIADHILEMANGAVLGVNVTEDERRKDLTIKTAYCEVPF
jgi:hypothetical protein